MKWKQKSLAALLTAASLALCILPAQALNVPSSFLALSKESTLNNPGIIVIDSNTHEVVFDHNPDVTRAPASVLKLVSTTSALREFGPDKVFGTTVSSTDKPNKFLLVGEG